MDLEFPWEKLPLPGTPDLAEDELPGLRRRDIRDLPAATPTQSNVRKLGSDNPFGLQATAQSTAEAQGTGRGSGLHATSMCDTLMNVMYQRSSNWATYSADMKLRFRNELAFRGQASVATHDSRPAQRVREARNHNMHI